MSRVWLNGVLLAASEARIDSADRGFTLGDGVFETLRAISGEPQYVDQHLARLRHGASVLGIGLAYSDETLADALRVIAGNADCALRLTLTRGPMARGLLPTGIGVSTVLITAGALPLLSPVRVMIARSTRRCELSPLSRIKSLNYLDNIIARREADQAGFDDAILLNTVGMVAGASAANLFLLRDGNWVTPRVSDGALPGLARGRLLAAHQASETSVTPQDLSKAPSAFLINSLGRRIISGCG